MKLIAVSTRSAKKDFYDLHGLVEGGFTAARMLSALRSVYPGEIDLDVGRHVALALTDFHVANPDPDPIVFDGTTWKAARRSAERLAAELTLHLTSLDRSGLLR